MLRSGLRWLRPDGDWCEAGDLFAYCNLGLTRRPGTEGPLPFEGETEDFQVAFAAPVAGRLRRAAAASTGGMLDRLGFSMLWTEDFVLGALEEPQGPSDGTVGLMFAVGRRALDLADDRSGFLTGWHDRTRAWWGDGVPPSVLGLGVCDQRGLLFGDGVPFEPMFKAVPAGLHLVSTPDQPLVHCARVTLEQKRRTPEQMTAIAEDAARTFPAGDGPAPSPQDWMFLGALLGSLGQAPTETRAPLLTRAGLALSAPPAVVAMSLASEPRFVLRHRRLGYCLRVHEYRVAVLGPGTVRWLQREFEPVLLEPDDIRRDFVALYDALNEDRRTDMVILNSYATQGFEDIATYAVCDPPLHRTVDSLWRRALDVMLLELARERDIDIIDADALACEHGGRDHAPDGVHFSGAMTCLARGQMLDLLRARGAAGFAPAAA
ncbi:MAG TPA: hypothetical protein VG939_15560 [Caulobacteraceae bacterium]|nr:hypothetical protein [Caulobacteraceae bacterium]